MKRYLVIADDITGSNDTGVQLTRRGIDTIVTVNPHGIGNDANSYVLDCESRSLSGSDAYSVVKNCLAHINLTDFDCVIKKVDSTIRGNVAEETMAVDEAIGAELVLFAPALPNLHRTTKNAIHMLNGVPVSQTEIANDPKTPVKNDNLIGVLSAVYDEPIGHISLSDIRNRQICFDSHRVYAADSVTNTDMETLVREAMKTGKKVLWVGSSGIADNLLEAERQTFPALAVVASVSEVTRAQIKFAGEKGARIVIVPAYELVKNRKHEEYISLAVDYLQSGEDVMLVSATSHDRSAMEKSDMAGLELGMSVDEMGHFIQDALGEMAEAVLTRTKVSGVFLSGGDTAIGFFQRMKLSGCKINEEIMVGIPSMTIVGGKSDGLKLITKAGAFGTPDAIFFAMRKLKEY